MFGDKLDWVLPVAGGFIVVMGAVTLIMKGVKWMFAVLHKANAFLDEWLGEDARPGHPRIPGVPERLAVMEERLKRVEGQVSPNGGGSLRDQVDKIVAQTDTNNP